MPQILILNDLVANRFEEATPSVGYLYYNSLENSLNNYRNSIKVNDKKYKLTKRIKNS